MGQERSAPSNRGRERQERGIDDQVLESPRPQAEASAGGARLVLPRRVALAVVLAICVTSSTVAGLTWTPRTGMSEIITGHPAAFIGFTLVWRHPMSPRSRAVWWYAAAMWAALVLGQLLTGVPIGRAAASALGDVVTGLVAVLVVTRLGRQEPSWFPRDPSDVVALLVAGAVAAPVGLLLGAYPWAPFGGTGDAAADGWSTLRGFVVLAIAMVSVMPLLHAPPVLHVRRGSPVVIALLPVVTAACLAPSFLFPSSMLGWLVIVPGVWAGMTLTPRLVAVVALSVPVLMSAAPYPPRSHSVVPPELGTDLLNVIASVAAILIVVSRQQTGRIQAELERRAEAEHSRRQLLGGVLDRMGDGMLLTDRTGAVLGSNPAAADLAGGALPERLGLDWARTIELQTADVGRLLEADDIRALVRPTGSLRTLDLVLPGRETGPRRLRVTARDLPVTRDGLVLMFVKDTTVEFTRQRELESFAGTVAHDLKSPLTGLRGWLEAAAEEVDAEDLESAAVAVRRARDATSRMDSLVDDMLAYTITQGGELQTEDVVIADVARDLAELYSGAGTGGATITVEAPHVVHADPALTRQVLANLIGNAMKYGRPGEPPYIEVCSYDGDSGWVEIEVSDKGRGLQPGDEERIFAAFGRSDKDASSVQGIGLGLSLCHAIVTRHGGRIGAENNEWGGATFMFLLPAAS